MPLISVIIPNYNYGHYLKSALDSILLTNTHSDYELIVVDDGSTDHSRAILGDYTQEKRVRLFLQECNQGVAAAVNFGIEQARGEFLHFFASDDLHKPGSLDCISEIMRLYPMTTVFTADYATFGDPTQISSFPLVPCKTFTYFSPQQVASLFSRTRFWIPGHSVFIKKSVCMPYDPSLGPVCDWLNNHILALEHGVGYLPQTLAATRLHSHSLGASLSLSSKRKMWLYLLQQLEHTPRYRPLIQTGILRMLGLRSIYSHLLTHPAYWKYLYPMARRELSLICNRCL